MFKNYILSPDERGLFTTFYSSDLQKNNLKGSIKKIITTVNKKSNLPFAPIHKQIFEISEFDRNGELFLYRELEGDRLYLKKEYLYEGGHLKSELVFDEDNVIVETVHFKHNNQGLMIEEFRKEYDTILTGIYDNKNNLTEVTEFSELQGDDRNYKIYRDQETQNIFKIEIYDEGNLSKKSNYQYDNNNNVILVEHFDANDELLSTEIIQYDYNDNITRLGRKDTRRTKEYLYEYSYDNKGNWLTQQFAVDGEISVQTRREIQYY